MTQAQGEAPLIPPPTLRTARKLGAAILRGFQLCELPKYPCIVKTGVLVDVVHGELYEITDENVDWAVLDEYEGICEDEPQPHEYRREVCFAFQSLIVSSQVGLNLT